VRGEDEEELVVEADGFVDLLVEFLAAGHVVGANQQRTPAFWRSAWRRSAKGWSWVE
jgi:hypothetical protein